MEKQFWIGSKLSLKAENDIKRIIDLENKFRNELTAVEKFLKSLRSIIANNTIMTKFYGDDKIKVIHTLMDNLETAENTYEKARVHIRREQVRSVEMHDELREKLKYVLDGEQVSLLELDVIKKYIKSMEQHLKKIYAILVEGKENSKYPTISENNNYIHAKRVELNYQFKALDSLLRSEYDELNQLHVDYNQFIHDSKKMLQY